MIIFTSPQNLILKLNFHREKQNRQI
uniref:Uncharacterized protein n=1 Tax=Arundo donax TaxID=35708 RepID=A0A0A9HQI3_ARUDO